MIAVLDKERILRFNLKAVRIFERETGESAFSPSTFQNMDGGTLENLLVAGLLASDSKLDKEKAIDLVGELSLEEATNIVTAMLEEGMPQEKKREKPTNKGKT